MPAAQLPINEPERLIALIALSILDTAPTADFNLFPQLASKLLDMPVAALSLVDQDRQWFKASVGLDMSQTSRDSAFCAHVVLDPSSVLYVPDTQADPRFADNPLVTDGPKFRSYAGAPIIGPDGHALGALCVLDHKPHHLTDDQLDHLRQLATGVAGALKLHRSVNDARRFAATDPLTGLANSAGFAAQLRGALARRAGPGLDVALLIIDLDKFQAINDLFSHAAGDVALREVATRLRNVIRAGDELSRAEGNEFRLILEAVTDPSDPDLLADRIHAVLGAPFLLNSQAVSIGASIGIAVANDGIDPEALVAAADGALAAAKRDGSGTVRASRSQPSMARLAVGRANMQSRLRAALLPPGREPFALALQPIHRRDGALAGFEALVRWPGENGEGTIFPDQFIPAAEATGLVVQLDRWVFDRACALAASWPGDLSVSSNLSAANFFAGDLVADIRAALQRHRLPAERLKLEITETVLLRDPARVKAVIDAIRKLGVRFVLDDFGAGHASISYLRDFDFAGLKIDRSLVSGIEEDAKSQTLVRAITAMAGALGMEVTAEGIETADQLSRLRAERIDLMQGYLFGKPMTPDAAAALAAREISGIRALATA